MKANKLCITAAVGTVMFLAACDVKDTIYEASLTSHPERGKITVMADWSGMGAGITKPSSYTVGFDGRTFPATSDRYEINDTFDPGSYKLYVYNTADHITVSGTTATATYAAGALGWLFTSAQPVTVEADRVHELTAAMQQQVRRLTLVIEPSGGTADQIESIAASLSGVAGSYDMESGAHGAATDVALIFTKQTAGDDAGKWTATVRLLGVTGAEQKLTGTIRFTGGKPGDMPLESDLSSDLSTFNADKKTPLSLGGTVAETPTGTGFTAIITGWNKVTGGTGTAN